MTDDEATRLRLLREQVEAEKDDIISQGRANKAVHDECIARLHDAIKLLSEERNRQGLSLADIQLRTGIAMSALSRLETEDDPNPTLATITRYADALGKNLQISLTDKR